MLDVVCLGISLFSPMFANIRAIWIVLDVVESISLFFVRGMMLLVFDDVGGGRCYLQLFLLLALF